MIDLLGHDFRTVFNGAFDYPYAMSLNSAILEVVKQFKVKISKVLIRIYTPRLLKNENWCMSIITYCVVEPGVNDFPEGPASGHSKAQYSLKVSLKKNHRIWGEKKWFIEVNSYPDRRLVKRFRSPQLPLQSEAAEKIVEVIVHDYSKNYLK